MILSSGVLFSAQHQISYHLLLSFLKTFYSGFKVRLLVYCKCWVSPEIRLILVANQTLRK